MSSTLTAAPAIATRESHDIRPILDKAIAGERISNSECLQLLQTHDLTALGAAADAVTRRLHPEDYRTYNIDRTSTTATSVRRTATSAPFIARQRVRKVMCCLAMCC